MEVRDLGKVELHKCREDRDWVKCLLLELNKYLAPKSALVATLLWLGEVFANVELVGN